MTGRLLMAVLLGLCLSGCGGQEERPIAVTLANLTDTPATYHGRLRVAEGIVHTFSEPRHYWIEDGELNRVALQPDHYAEDHVDERVRATGRYLADHQGRRILLTASLQVLPDSSER